MLQTCCNYQLSNKGKGQRQVKRMLRINQLIFLTCQHIHAVKSTHSRCANVQGPKTHMYYSVRRFMMVSKPHLIWETKRDKKTDDYDKGPAKINTEGGIRMAAHSSWNRHGGGWKVRGNSMENQAKTWCFLLTRLSCSISVYMSAGVYLCGFGLQPLREGSDMKWGGTGNGGVWNRFEAKEK